MKDAGGFEGNAQTLRVLARLEKKRKGFGLNLTCRSLAAIVKKDAEIGTLDEDGQRVKKGYYRSERKIVRQIREQVLGKDAPPGSLRSVSHPGLCFKSYVISHN
jgi:dGTPase